jgi:hypothetical protein
LEEKVAAPVYKIKINDRREPVALTTQHPLCAEVGTTSQTSGGRSVGIVRSRTKTTEFSFSVVLDTCCQWHAAHGKLHERDSLMSIITLSFN